MIRFIFNPFSILVGTFLVLGVAAWFGATMRRIAPLDDDRRHDFNLVVAATLTLLGLLIAFSFSMAASRYDQRKNYEEAEANAIGTAYLRCELLAPAERDELRALLRRYVDLRIRYYGAPRDDVRQINRDTAELQSRLWSTTSAAAKRQPTAVTALLVSSINEVINAQGYTQAAWANYIPTSATMLMALVAVLCNLLVGYGSRSANGRSPLLLVLPIFVAVAFMLINDMDAPRHGLVLIAPSNLVSLGDTLRPP